MSVIKLVTQKEVEISVVCMCVGHASEHSFLHDMQRNCGVAALRFTKDGGTETPPLLRKPQFSCLSAVNTAR